MADLSKIKLNGTTYNFKDAEARDKIKILNVLVDWNSPDGDHGYYECTFSGLTKQEIITAITNNDPIYIKWPSSDTTDIIIPATVVYDSYEEGSINLYGIYDTQLYIFYMDTNTTGYMEEIQINNPQNISAFNNDVGYLTSYTETDPTVPAWAKAASKPTYTASEVGALPSSTTYVSSFNGSSGAITYTAPVTSVNGQTGVVTITDSDEKVKYTDLNGTNSTKGFLLSSNLLSNGSSITETVYSTSKLNWNDSNAALYIYDVSKNKYATLSYNLLKLSNSSTTYTGRLTTTNITENRNYQLPDNSGTLALTSDIDNSKLKTTASSDNTEYNLLGTATSDNNTSAVSIYKQDLLSFAKTSSLSRLTIGSTATPGVIRIYTSTSGASGFTDLKSAASGTTERTITLPDANGTVALTTDIPSVPSWALNSTKPSYTFSELTSHPTTLNDYGITDAYTKTEVDGLVSGVLHYKGTKAATSALPSSGNVTGDVWHVTADGSEWAWDGSAWQELGTATDLSGYLQTGDIAAWAKAANKPTYTASEVGALPSSTTYVSSFNGNSGAITYTAPVTSVNGQTGVVTIADENVKQSSVSESNSSSLPVLFSTANGNGEITTSTYKHNSFVYQPSTGRLSVKNIQVGSVAQPGKISLGSISFTAPTDTTTNTITLPNASGTVALTTDIPSISAWAKATNKPTYTASEVGALPSSTTYVSSVNGQSGAISINTPLYVAFTYDENTDSTVCNHTYNEVLSAINNNIPIVCNNPAYNEISLGNNKITFYCILSTATFGESDDSQMNIMVITLKNDNTVTINQSSDYLPSSSVSIANTLSSGTLIATIDGVDIYAPAYTDADGVSY